MSTNWEQYTAWANKDEDISLASLSGIGHSSSDMDSDWDDRQDRFLFEVKVSLRFSDLDDVRSLVERRWLSRFSRGRLKRALNEGNLGVGGGASIWRFATGRERGISSCQMQLAKVYI